MNSTGNKSLSRRHLLRGAGCSIALPFLDAMVPATARAQVAKGPLRVGYLFFPHGTHSGFYSWRPATFGASFQFPKGLASSQLVNHKQDLVVVGGLRNEWSVYGVYPGGTNDTADHGAASASYLTGARPNWKAAIPSFTLSSQPASASLPQATGMKSVDVLIAEKIGASKKIPVLHLTPQGTAPTDAGTAHYSIDFRTYLSWNSPNTPTPRYNSPAAAFKALFGDGAPPPNPTPTPTTGPDTNARKKSVLDFALGEANSLKATLGPTDQVKLDEYLTSIRSVEKTIQSATTEPPPPLSCTPGAAPSGNLAFDAMTKAYLDLIVLAFQCDQTRVVSYLMDYELNSRNYSFAGTKKFDGHQASHGGFNEDYTDAYKIVDWYANQFAYLVSRMKAVSDAGGTLLSQSILHLGSGENTTGGDHPDTDLPMVLAGQGGGLLSTGRAINANRAPLSNYHLTLLNKVGVAANSFGDSTGTIADL